MSDKIKKILSDSLNSKAQELEPKERDRDAVIIGPVDPPIIDVEVEDEEDPCKTAPSECRSQCDDDYGTESEIREDRQQCIEYVVNPFEDGMNIPTGEDFCNYINDMCECTKDYNTTKCQKWECQDDCRRGKGCDGMDGDPPCGGDCSDCKGDSIYCNQIPDCNSPDHRTYCRNLERIVNRALKEAEKNLGQDFDNCVDAAGGPQVTPQNRSAICNCRRDYVRKLDGIQRRKCQIIKNARCPRDTDRDVDRAYSNCMKKLTGNSSWQARCPGLNPTESCNPRPKPSKWNVTKSACQGGTGTNPGGGGFGNPGGGGGGRPPRRPPRTQASDRLTDALQRRLEDEV